MYQIKAIKEQTNDDNIILIKKEEEGVVCFPFSFPVPETGASTIVPDLN
jgi:hypothetical protein